ncbi:translation initiation factor IF-5A [Candidatus Woesearchaeota archaeon]|nr:translation initiation factor IF-5A [Candidatus Woesearchaeota archaeon]
MGETKPVSIGGLKKGNYIVIEEVACKVSDIQVSRPGKHGHAKIRLTGVGLMDGKKRIIVAPGHDNVDTPIVEKRTAQVLSLSGDKANVMDNESYETFDLDIPAELKEQCKDGVQILYWIILDDKVMKQVQNG